jgi:solute carrier family 35 (UDP-sugar transporter), member A1/2/3
MELPSIRMLSLTGLCFNYTALTIFIHISRNWHQAGAPHYKASSVVVIAEMIKLASSVLLAFRETAGAGKNSEYRMIPETDVDEGQKAEALDVPHPSARQRLLTIRDEVFASDLWRIGIPAALFTLQSNLQFVAIANLSVPVFQCLAQLKVGLVA